MSISTRDDLQFLLHRALEIEKKFESTFAWKGFVAVVSIYRKTIMILTRDSHKHRFLIEKLLERLNLDAPTNEIPSIEPDFNGKLDVEILQKIIEQDEMAADLYTEILNETDPNLIAKLLGTNKIEFFYEVLQKIVDDEKRHMRLVRALTGNIARIL